MVKTQVEAAPAGTPPGRSSPLRVARRLWKRLRTMRTAIILLFVLAAAASIGSLIPQRPVNEFAVFRWKQRHAGVAGLAEHLGLFDVYGSAWFTAIYALLLTSVVGCLVPRYRAFWRVVRAKPKPGVRGTERHEGTTALEPDAALGRAERVLRRRRYRTARIDGGVAGEKGHFREGGSLIFHTAFLLLLVGIAIGKGWGFSGQVAVVEGDRFTDTRVAYDSVREGSHWGDRHRGFTLQVDDFTVTFNANGVPKDFVSRVELSQGSTHVKTTDIRVNNPLVYRGMSIFQLAWGWAPHVLVKQNGRTLTDGPVVFLPEGNAWRGVVKLPSASPDQVGIEMFFYNDLRIVKDDIPVNASPLPRRPVLFYQEYRGDLGLDRSQSVYDLDKQKLSAGDVGGIPMGGSSKLLGGIEISFPDLKQYTVFQVAADPGQPIVLAAAILILVGLIPALYSSRRRVWVRAERAADAARVEVSGLALQRKAAFEEEFKTLVRELGRNLQDSGVRS